ncbi:hypothetical protein I350_03988 [Cryptococcus amylolentus CBS 6273]|uniref:Uncharacterized protein n=1 Tax=Cryptococcus amylolentus CBS 6273 TaxID=1296118 RepID=A0A1E3K0X7_9TREE|nr:hypothetical protein I350_03988 [Cryptococcus amylolentus CBS 6273]
MLPTPLRARQKRHQQTVDAAKAYQHESPPAAGPYPHTSASDSQHQDQETSDEGGRRGDNFGVESMSEWGSYMSSVKQAQREDALGGRSHAAGGRDVSPISTEGLVFHRLDDEDGDFNGRSSGQVEPPSPEETLHPLEPIDPVNPSPTSHPLPLPFHSHLRLADLPPPGTPTSPSIPGSEPGSPMSLASMPSYVASMSSLSRTSSVDSPIHDHDETQGGSFRAEGDGGDRGLVLPQLNLPSESLSLHLSLPRWLNSWSSADDHNQPHNKRGPITLALVGEREEVERLLREVKERVEMVKLDNGVGVLQNGKIGIRIVSGLKLDEQVQKSIHQAYQALNALLSPVPPPSTEMESELKRLIDGYASREDWIHGVIVLGEVGETSLDKMIPTITLSAPTASPELSHETPHPENHALPESTPKLTGAGLSYFALPAHEEQPEFDEESVAPSDLEHSPSISDSIPPKLSPKAEVLLSLFASPRNLAERSTTSFLTWRRSPYLSTPTSSRASYPTSPSPSASSYYAGAMPTVARAQGGGEWEATLSRRVAQRRESGDAVMSKSGKELLKVTGQRKRRRSIDKGTGRGDYHQALFPRVSPGNTGKKDNMSSIIRKALAEWKGRLFPGTNAGAESGGKGGEGGKDSGRRIWKWGVVAGAVVLLGWGVWLGVKS